MWIGIILGLVIGIILCAIFFLPKLKQTKQLDKQIEQQNRTELALYNQRKKDVDELNQKLVDLTDTLQQKQNNADDYAQKYLDSKVETANAQFDAKVKELDNLYSKAEEEGKEEYLATLEEYTVDFQKQIEEKNIELAGLLEKIRVTKAAVDAAVEVNKRAAAERDKADFYRIVLSDEDKKEIKELQELLSHFRNPEPLNKVIWKTYYEKPYTDLIGRVVGSSIKTGIYKITNITSGMCYIGKSTNIADRWKQHIKRGMGAETPTQNKLYPAMLKEGVDNFTFEIVEECKINELPEKEKYWITFYQGMEFGYNMKRG